MPAGLRSARIRSNTFSGKLITHSKRNQFIQTLKKTTRYITGILLLFFVAYNSVYFKKLDLYKSMAAKDFDAGAYSRSYYKTKLVPALANAMELDKLIGLLKIDKDKTFEQY